MKRLALIAPLLLAALLGFGYGSLPAGPNINMTSAAPRLLFSDPTGSAATFASSTARTCPTGSSLADVGVNVPCYDPVTGWLRSGKSVTNYTIKLQGVPGNTPTGYSAGAGPGTPLLAAGGIYENVSVTYTEGAAVAQNVYRTAGIGVVAQIIGGYWLKTTAGTAGTLYVFNTYRTISSPIGNVDWTRVTYSGPKEANNNYFLGSYDVPILSPAPPSGAYAFSAPFVELAVLYPGAYCPGAASPVTCSAELSTHTLSATQLPPSRGRLRVSVKPFWAATELGISRTVLHNLGGDAVSGTADDLWLDYNQAASTWRWRAGGQTVSSAVSAHAREATIALEVTWQDGHKISISVDGGVPAYSAGVMASAVLHATTGRGTTVAGADQFDGYVGDLEVWSR